MFTRYLSSVPGVEVVLDSEMTYKKYQAIIDENIIGIESSFSSFGINDIAFSGKSIMLDRLFHNNQGTHQDVLNVDGVSNKIMVFISYLSTAVDEFSFFDSVDKNKVLARIPLKKHQKWGCTLSYF